MNEKAKKILDISIKVVTWLLIAFSVFMMIFTIFTVSTVDRNDRSIFGVKFYIVQSDSMSPSENNAHLDVHFSAGDIVIIKNVDDPTALKKDTIISFMSTNTDSYGETITHMIYDVRYDKSGNVLGYVTYGTNTGALDEELVEPAYVLGEYAGKLPNVGTFFAFVKSTPGYIVCILVPFLLLILYNGVNVIRLFRRYKQEQNEKIEAERAEIEAERKQNEEMMRELLALKAQLEQKNGASAPTAPSTDSAEATSYADSTHTDGNE